VLKTNEQLQLLMALRDRRQALHLKDRLRGLRLALSKHEGMLRRQAETVFKV
jgi:hypothetical protein